MYNLVAAAAACCVLCCQPAPAPLSLLVRCVAWIDACSLARSLLVPFYCTSLRVLQGRARCGSKRGHVPAASRQRCRLWLDFRNDLPICRAWVQFFCNGMGRKLGRGWALKLTRKVPLVSTERWERARGMCGIGKVKRERPWWCVLLLLASS